MRQAEVLLTDNLGNRRSHWMDSARARFLWRCDMLAEASLEAFVFPYITCATPPFAKVEEN